MTPALQRQTRNPDDFPTLQLFLLAVVRLAEPVALTSIFPYAWSLVKKFQVGDENDASFYAGLLISSFALAEALSSVYWGGLSDRIGRKPVLLVGCCGTILSMLVVGFASNIWLALAGRAVGGFLNGNIGIIQTMVGELVTKPEHEPRAYSIMPFVWSVGCILGPAIGGLTADPVSNLGFDPEGLFGTFPYLLPNLICASLLLVSVVVGFVLLEETHPDFQPRVSLPDSTYMSEESPLVATSDAIKMPAVDLRAEAYGTFDDSDHKWRHAATVKTDSTSILTRRIMALVLALGIFSYHSMTFDHLLPIFLEDDRHRPFSTAVSSQFNPFFSPGGLGLSVQKVGGIMSVNGIIALFIQAVIFPTAAKRLGVYGLFVVVTVLHPITYLIMPALITLPDSWLMVGIYASLAVRNVLSILAYPVLLILIKEATPSASVLGKINGVAASAGAACRTVAPPVAGYLYAVGSRMDFTGLAWYGSALVAALGALQCFMITRQKPDTGFEIRKERSSAAEIAGPRPTETNDL